MRARFSSWQVVVIVVAFAATVVLGPIAALAATGQLVNIADPDNATRLARVTGSRTLTVETRAGSIDRAFNGQAGRLGLGRIVLAQTLAGFNNTVRMAITDVTITAQGPGGFQYVDLEALVRVSGSNPCSNPTSGFQVTTLRRVALQNNTTLQLNFDGPPLLTPTAGSLQLLCFVLNVTSTPVGGGTQGGATGYTFTP